MSKQTDPNQGALVLPATRDGRTPSGMKTSIAGAGNRITRTHELGERVFLFVETKVKKSGHEETDDGVIYAEGLKVLDLFELDDAPGKRLLSALRQAYRTASGEDPLTLGDETAGEGIEVALDAAGVAITPAELAALREDPSSAMDDDRFDHVVLVFRDGSRGLWPDDWAGTGQSRAPIGGTMRRPGSTTKGDVDQVVELLDAATGESLDVWTEERENARLLTLEEGATADEALEAAKADREVHDQIVGGDGPDDELEVDEPADLEPDTVPDEPAGDPDEPGAPFADEVAYLPGPEHFAAVDVKVDNLRKLVRPMTDRDQVLRMLKAEQMGRGRDLKPRSSVVELLEKRAGELFAELGNVDAPDLDPPAGFEPGDEEPADDFGPGPDELEG